MGLNVAFSGFGGNLTRDVELKTLESGTSVANFSVAVNKSFKKGDGTKVDKTDFFNFVAWGKTAEFLEQYFKKGDSIFVLAEPYVESWESKEGEKRSAVKFKVTEARFAGSKKGGDATPAAEQPEPAGNAGGDNEIPF